jgi:hypothetical protein
MLNWLTWPAAAISSALARRHALDAIREGDRKKGDRKKGGREGGDPVAAPPPGLASAALDVMTGWEGKGEEGGNNRGPWIEKWSGKKKANWCAAIIGAAFQQAAAQLEMPLPFEFSLGAKRLGKNIGNAGSFVEIDFLIPGDVIVLHRGPRGAWTGHIRLFHSYDITNPDLLRYYAGNEGRYPAVCRPGTMSVDARDVVFCARAPAISR